MMTVAWAIVGLLMIEIAALVGIACACLSAAEFSQDEDL